MWEKFFIPRMRIWWLSHFLQARIFSGNPATMSSRVVTSRRGHATLRGALTNVPLVPTRVCEGSQVYLPLCVHSGYASPDRTCIIGAIALPDRDGVYWSMGLCLHSGRPLQQESADEALARPILGCWNVRPTDGLLELREDFSRNTRDWVLRCQHSNPAWVRTLVDTNWLNHLALQ